MTTSFPLQVDREKLGEKSRWKNSGTKGMMSATCGVQLCVRSYYCLYGCIFDLNVIMKNK